MKPRAVFPAERGPSRLRHTVPKTPWHVRRAGFSDREWTDILPGLPTHVTRGLRVGGECSGTSHVGLHPQLCVFGKCPTARGDGNSVYSTYRNTSCFHSVPSWFL